MSDPPRLAAHTASLAALRFCPMHMPAAEVGALTGRASHLTHHRMIRLWRIAAGHAGWTAEEGRLLHESTLDTISAAFDPYTPPIGRIMLDARADAWDAGVAPDAVRAAVAASDADHAPPPAHQGTLLVCGEVAQLREPTMAAIAVRAAAHAGVPSPAWHAATAAVPFALGARQIASQQAERLRIQAAGARRLIADGPETFWALTRLLPQLDCALGPDVEVVSLTSLLRAATPTAAPPAGPVFVHDARAAYLLSETEPEPAASMPGFERQPGAAETTCGRGAVFDVPRHILAKLGAAQVWGAWTRGLAKSAGGDDALWRTHPALADGLARLRATYARALGAASIATDSPLSAAALRRVADAPAVLWLPEAFA
jgi:hypothetical protein